MLKKISHYFKTKAIINEKKRDLQKTGEKTTAEQLAINACQWVQLLWAGKKQSFLIYKTNMQNLLLCGRFPNLLYQFVNGLAGQLDADELKVEAVDAKRMKEEEEEFLHELARKSMIEPSYQDCYDAILKMRGINASEIDDVIPRDFLNDLWFFYLKDFEESIKKKSKELTLNASAGSQNTGKKPQASTFSD